jgi:hypothetical protein
MPISAPRIPLATADPASLPEGPAIYVLWRDEVPIHAGFVTRFTQSLAERMRMHMPEPGGEPTPGGPTHFSFLLTENPLQRLADILPLLDAGQEPKGS